MSLNDAKSFNRRPAPESGPIPGSTQVANSGGGDSWQVDDWTEDVNAPCGWGRGFRTTVGRWFLEQEAEKLTRQVVKYQRKDLSGHHPPGSGVGPVSG